MGSAETPLALAALLLPPSDGTGHPRALASRPVALACQAHGSHFLPSLTSSYS